MLKLDCWEYMQCGRQPMGDRVSELGVCPAAVETRMNGINEGRNSGRCCWAVAGTFCGSKAQCSQAAKVTSCLDCAFMNEVRQQQGKKFIKAGEIHRMFNSVKRI